jgi:hypothetical protein
MSWFSEEYKRFENKVKTNVSGISAEIENFKKIDLGSPNYNQIKLNTDQDFSPFVKGAVVWSTAAVGSAAGLALAGPYGGIGGAAVGAELGQNINQNLFGSRYDPSVDGGKIQKAVTQTATDIQRESVNTGKGIQNAVIVNTGDLQERAVDIADRNNLGSNPTLEKWANEVTTSVEGAAADTTSWYEANASGITKETEKGAALATTLANNTSDALGDVYDLLTGKVPEEPSMDDLAADVDSGLTPEDESTMKDPFTTVEDGTAKDDQMTEEEKMRRIRRLLLNRYGREDTILTGTADTANRRTYAL